MRGLSLSHRRRFVAVRCLVLGVALGGCASSPPESSVSKQAPMAVIPITAANLRGQASLYNEGWFIVSSSDKALRYAKDHSITSSAQVMARVRDNLAKHTGEWGEGLGDVVDKGVQTGATVFKKGTALSRAELVGTHQLAQAEIDYGSRTMQAAWGRFAKGWMTLSERTAEDRAALKAIPGEYFSTLQDDFSNLNALSEKLKEKTATHIEGRWGEAFGEARQAFSHAYERSGTRSNSLVALGDLTVGYVSVLFSGLVKPTARSTVQATEATVKVGTKIVFLPVAGLFVVAGRTVSSVGMSLYYTTSMGVKLVSPTVEGGLLAGMSLLSYAAVPVTYVAGGTVGVVNQVAVTAAAPAAGVGHSVVDAAADTAVYAAQVSFDLVEGTTKVAMHQVQSGIALGYNALTAIPTQLLLGTVNGVVFLAWDGPRLVLATAKGEVQWHDQEGGEGRVPMQSLPVGTVVDLQMLGKEPGVTVEVLSDDPEIVQRVLEKLPQDLRFERSDEARSHGEAGGTP